MDKYEGLTDDRFDEILTVLINQSPASHLLTIPGVYELVKEDYNNMVLEDYEQSIEVETENQVWELEYECPRCGDIRTPAEVETSSCGSSCFICGLENHPVFEALDKLCAGGE